MKTATPEFEASARRLHSPLVGLGLLAPALLALLLAWHAGMLGTVTHLGMGTP